MIFIRSTLREILTVFLIAFSILVVVFAVEKFDYVARLAIDYGLELGGFLILFVSDLPSIMDLILPIATVVASYVALLAIRERREFIIMAAAGVGARPLILVAATVALATSLASAVVSGFVKPMAKYAFRQQYERSLAELVSEGPEGGRFFEAPETVVYTSPGTGRDDRKLRVFGFDGARVSYVYLSDCARMRIEGGMLYSDTCQARVYRFKAPATLSAAEAATMVLPSECPTCDDERARLPVVRVEGRRTEKTFDMHTLFKTIERDRVEEHGIDELLAVDRGAFVSIDAARRGVRDLLMAAANVFAVACALAAVALTTLATRFLALPLAVALLLATVVAVGSGSAIPEALLTPLGASALVLGVFGFFFAAIVAVIVGFRQSLVAPRMRRS